MSDQEQAHPRRDQPVNIAGLQLAPVELGNERVLGPDECPLQRQVVGVKAQEEQCRHQGYQRVLRLAGSGNQHQNNRRRG